MPHLTPPVTEKDHCQGNQDAKVTLVEYGDYQCPSCGDAYPVVKQLQKHFGERLRFVFRNFPLEQHPMAEPAAETAEFAAAQGKFWAMHDALYENQDNLSTELFPKLAKQLGLDPKKLDDELDRGTYKQAVEQGLQSGDASGVEGTPTFYINGKRHEGDYDLQSLQRALEAVKVG